MAEPSGVKRLTIGEAFAVAKGLGTLGTGSTALDGLLGGGYAEGRITEVFGPSSSGKSQLAMQATVMAAAKGWRSVYVDTEATFRPERVAQIAEVRGLDPKATLDSVFFVRVREVGAQTRAMERMADDERVRSAKLLVVDTVTKNFSLAFPDKELVGRRQGALGAYLNRMAVDAYLNRRVVLLTNRVASVTRDGVTRDVSLGGLTLRKFARAAVRLSRDGGAVLASLEFPPGAGPPTRCRLSERGFE